MNDTLLLVGLGVAFVLFLIDVLRSKGQSLSAWGGAVGFGALVLWRLMP